MSATPRVVLIGGTSCSGKSTLVAKRVAEHLEAHLQSVDSLRLKWQGELGRPSWRGFFPDNYPRYLDTSPPEELAAEQDHLTAWFCERVLTEQVEAALSREKPVVFEGDDLRPGWAARWRGISAVAALWVLASDEQQLTKRIAHKTGLTGKQLAVQAGTHWLYTRLLRDETKASHFPSIDAEPMESIGDRALAKLFES
jgi:hypothetical protein